LCNSERGSESTTDQPLMQDVLEILGQLSRLVENTPDTGIPLDHFFAAFFEVR